LIVIILGLTIIGIEVVGLFVTMPVWVGPTLAVGTVGVAVRGDRRYFG